MDVLFWSGYTFFGRIVSVCAIDGREKKVLGVEGVGLQLLQICLDYNSLPSVKEMEIDEINFFYKARIKDLCKMQKG